jgi:hypothetical protein
LTRPRDLRRKNNSLFPPSLLSQKPKKWKLLIKVPTHPYEGQQWKEIRHDNTVTWLAFWKVRVVTFTF